MQAILLCLMEKVADTGWPFHGKSGIQCPQLKETVQELCNSASSQLPAWQVQTNSRSRVRVLSRYSGWTTSERLAAAFRKISVIPSYVNTRLISLLSGYSIQPGGSP